MQNLNSSDFSSLEKNVYIFFSDIVVDDEVVKQKINAKLLEKRKTKNNARTKLMVAFSALFIFIGINVAHGAVGGLNGFLAMFNPPFMNYSTPPLQPAIAYDQGFRFEVHGAQQWGNVILLHYQIQDLTGENRLHPSVSVDFKIYQDPNFGGRSARKRLSFNQDTNTIYFESLLVADFNIPTNEPLLMTAYRINDLSNPLGTGQMVSLATGHWEVEINPTDTSHQVIEWTTPFVVDNIIVERMRLTPAGVEIVATLVDQSITYQWLDDMGFMIDWSFLPNMSNVSIETNGFFNPRIGGSSASGHFQPQAGIYEDFLIGINDMSDIGITHKIGWNAFWRVNRPIDIDNVIGIRIFNQFIPLPY